MNMPEDRVDSMHIQAFAEHASRTGALIAQTFTPDELSAWLAGRVTGKQALIPAPETLPPPYRNFFSQFIAQYPAALHSGLSVEEISRCDLGISLADAGVIETGSVVFAQNDLDLRLAGMLPPVQIAILPVNRIVQSLDDLGRRIRNWQAGDRRYVSVVTGPSRSSDIERVLTLGVHGPKELQILLGPASEEG